MKRTSLSEMPCPVARSLDVVGHWWSLLIVRNAFYGHTRFKQFQEHLGISRNILATRLQELTEHGVLEKIADRQGSKYPEYILTDKGKDLMPILVAFGSWGNRWAAPGDGPGLEMIDIRDGSVIPDQQILNVSGAPVPMDALGTRPGPGAKRNRKKSKAD